jgi:hypothetical protein
MKGYVYKLWSTQTADIYIGSTKERYLGNRLSKHKWGYKKYILDKQHYVTSYEIVKYDDCKIECLEVIEFNDIVELRAKEGQYIRELNCVNKVIPGRTHKEWDNDNKEARLKIKKKYRDNNKDKAAEYYQSTKEGRQVMIKCECGKDVMKCSMARHIKQKQHLQNIESYTVEINSHVIIDESVRFI